MTSGSSPSARRSSGVRGRGCFLLLVLLIFFASGFYTGVRAARHAMAQGPDWARRLFGLPTGSAAQTQIGTASTSNQPPAGNSSAAPTAQQPPSTASSSSSTTSSPPATSTTPATTDSGEQGQPEGSAPPQADLPTLVQQYNDVLHRIQEAQHHYALAQQQAASKTKSQDLQPLLNEQESLLKDMTAAAQRAKTLQAQIKADPQFADSYQEGAPCLTPGEVPTRLLNLGLENLRFIEPGSSGKHNNAVAPSEPRPNPDSGNG
ncbi:MAG TPA: hypothetical protein VFA07_00100 [Chthonomonadaceae bacterium]|nr:hypothetical protein [Chthonomonadaceae bacterium]